MEGSHSGLVRRTRNAVSGKPLREFESPPFRRKKLPVPKGGKKPAPKAREWEKKWKGNFWFCFAVVMTILYYSSRLFGNARASML